MVGASPNCFGSRTWRPLGNRFPRGGSALGDPKPMSLFAPRSVLTISVRKNSNRPQIPEALLIFAPKWPLEVQISQGLGPFFQIEPLKAGRKVTGGMEFWSPIADPPCGNRLPKGHQLGDPELLAMLVPLSSSRRVSYACLVYVAGDSLGDKALVFVVSNFEPMTSKPCCWKKRFLFFFELWTSQLYVCRWENPWSAPRPFS